MNKTKPLISAQELDALIGGWGYSSNPAMVDKFFPIRIVLLITLGTLASFSLLFFTDNIFQALHNNSEATYIKRYMYFRG